MSTKQQTCFFGILVTSLMILTAAAVPASADGEKNPGGNVASVNGAIITYQEFNREVNQIQENFSRRGRVLNQAQLSELKKGILENLINRVLLFQESQKKNINITDSDVDRQMGKIKNGFATELEYNNALKKMKISESEIKAKIKYDMTIQRFINLQLADKITISDKEARAYYDNNPKLFKQAEQVKASHILIKVESQASASQKSEVRKQIENVQQKLKKGDDFAALAEKYSQGPSRARKGDLGYFKRGQMVKPFENVAFALKPGEVSEIVETQFGYHLIKVFDKKPETMTVYSKTESRLKQHLKQEKVRRKVLLYAEKLKKDAVVERFL